MSLHAKNVAIAAGAKGKIIDKIAKILVKKKEVRIDKAREVLKKIQQKNDKPPHQVWCGGKAI